MHVGSTIPWDIARPDIPQKKYNLPEIRVTGYAKLRSISRDADTKSIPKNDKLRAEPVPLPEIQKYKEIMTSHMQLLSGD